MFLRLLNIFSTRTKITLENTRGRSGFLMVNKTLGLLDSHQVIFKAFEGQLKVNWNNFFKKFCKISLPDFRGWCVDRRNRENYIYKRPTVINRSILNQLTSSHRHQLITRFKFSFFSSKELCKEFMLRPLVTVSLYKIQEKSVISLALISLFHLLKVVTISSIPCPSTWKSSIQTHIATHFQKVSTNSI